MATVALVLILAAAVECACLIVHAIRRRRTPPELRGDWWTPFEREFREYVRSTAPPPGPRRRPEEHGSAGR